MVTDIDDIIDAYKKSLKKRKETIAYNQKIKKKVRITHTLFALFFLCAVYAYLKPQYIRGFHGTSLDAQIQAEYAYLVANGWKDVNEIQSYLEEYRENKQNAYLILGNAAYCIDEIPELLLHTKWGFLVKPVFGVANLVSIFANRGYDSVISLFTFLKDSGNGIIHIQHLGDVAASGIWIFFLYFLYLSAQWFRGETPTHTHYPSQMHYYLPHSATAYSSILIRDEEYSHVVSFFDMVEIINCPLERIHPPIVYAWIYNILGIGEGESKVQ